MRCARPTFSISDFDARPLDTDKFLSDFKANLLDYVEYYPSDLPAAVDAEQLKFQDDMKEKDRANFKANMTAYLSQYAPGADPIDPTQLDANFTKEQYALFKKKFGRQTTAVVSGGDEHGTDVTRFAPAEIARDLSMRPEGAPLGGARGGGG